MLSSTPSLPVAESWVVSVRPSSRIPVAEEHTLDPELETYRALTQGRLNLRSGAVPNVHAIEPDLHDIEPVTGFTDEVHGLFVATHRLPPVGSLVELSIDVGEDAPMHVVAHVAWHREASGDRWPGVGLHVGDEVLAEVCRKLPHGRTLFFPE
ncbi:MAG TPA: hypothetical protein RMH85_16660 [Polyangiaceae bacterium LLY-WYZ-15_(1-7)]|nr:hypothetical protein [Myxococcales bacterium]MAT26655.1 hypothetical protein [Sandaracinus sp.]HJK91085.1 hypothetical protein [Polyangiaceae bacterium LLY-WYZ-15_(1-7)]MBJ72448.1 hypothetical protein [Sandaracinus sp.]HJL01304.1 hypothetical protein [Polyangiaceae bacterium LLY-WYZ-15_(1-7)]